MSLELTSRRKIGGGFEAEIGVLFCFSAEFILSNNAKRLFFKGSVSLLSTYFLSAIGFLWLIFYVYCKEKNFSYTYNPER